MTTVLAVTNKYRQATVMDNEKCYHITCTGESLNFRECPKLVLDSVPQAVVDFLQAKIEKLQAEIAAIEEAKNLWR